MPAWHNGHDDADRTVYFFQDDFAVPGAEGDLERLEWEEGVGSGQWFCSRVVRRVGWLFLFFFFWSFFFRLSS